MAYQQQPGVPPMQPGYGAPPESHMQPGYGAPPPYSNQPPGYGNQIYAQGPSGATFNPGEVVNVWMPHVEAVPDCPKGLEYLTKLDQVLIKQKTHMLEVLLDWECQNKYKVLNNQGQQCYYAFEKSNVLCRQCCGSSRSFKIHVADNTKKTVFTIKRPFKCCGGCCWCACMRCAQDEVKVEAEDGTNLGYVRQACSFIKPHYTVLDHNREPQFEIWGPVCPCTLCNKHIEFPVKTIGSDHVVAKISKQWSGIAKEFFTDSDNFGITFPMDLDVRMKATLMGCVFLIDFMYFEDNDDGAI